jgi:hypothetical protein
MYIFCTLKKETHQKLTLTVQEPGGPIDSAPASVGALGGGRLPWPCQPLLHRPNGTVSHGSHALRCLALLF